MMNVRDFGAYGDGVTDDTAAIRNAIAASTGAAIGGRGSIGFFTAPSVFFPSGTYLISSSLNVPEGTGRLHGDQAILQAANDTVDVFVAAEHGGNPGYGVIIDHLIISGGHNAISIWTNHLDTDCISITNCEFHQQTGAVLHIDNKSPSTRVVIDNCKIYDLLKTGHVVNMASGDEVYIHDCWVTSCKRYVFNVTGGILNCENILGVPNNGDGAWAYCNGGSFLAHRFRFGGENGGKVFVEWHTLPVLLVGGGADYPPSQLVLEDCATFSPKPSPPQTAPLTIKFYSLPGIVRCRGNAGGSFNLYFDPSIPANQRQLMQRLFYADFRGNYSDWYADPTSDQMVATMMTAVPRGEDFEHGNYITPADRALFIPALAAIGEYGTVTAGWGNDNAPTNVAPAIATTDLFGDSIPSFRCSNPAAVANCGVNYYTGLDGLCPGPYTAAYEVEVLNGHGYMAISAAGTNRQFYLRQGRHVLDLHFWHTYSNLLTPAWQAIHAYAIGDIIVVSDGYGLPPTGAVAWRCVTAGMSGSTADPFVGGFANAQINDGTAVWEWVEDLSIGYDVQMFGNTQVNVGAIRVFYGHVTIRDWRTTVYGSAIPTTGCWQVGDKIINTAPVAGGVEGWICTAAGGAGSGNWVAGTPYYGVGTCVLNNGVVYQCMQRGIPAGSGTGPAGYAGTLNIPDGGCFWNAIANTQAAFKSFGSISP